MFRYALANFRSKLLNTHFHMHTAFPVQLIFLDLKHSNAVPLIVQYLGASISYVQLFSSVICSHTHSICVLTIGRKIKFYTHKTPGQIIILIMLAFILY